MLSMDRLQGDVDLDDQAQYNQRRYVAHQQDDGGQ
jgi:hypothetical protein